MSQEIFTLSDNSPSIGRPDLVSLTPSRTFEDASTHSRIRTLETYVAMMRPRVNEYAAQFIVLNDRVRGYERIAADVLDRITRVEADSTARLLRLESKLDALQRQIEASESLRALDARHHQITVDGLTKRLETLENTYWRKLVRRIKGEKHEI